MKVFVFIRPFLLHQNLKKHTSPHSDLIGQNLNYSYAESRGQVVTRRLGSQKVWGSIPAATKIVRGKNLAFNIGECVSRGSDTT